MFRAAALILLAILLIAASPIQNSRHEPAPPPKKETTSGHQNTQDADRGTERAPLVVKVERSPLTQEDAAQEKADTEEKISTDHWIIELTIILAFIGVVQTIVFGVQSWLLKKTIDETRRIGEAQVETYVSIPTAVLDFIDNFLPGDALPRLTIVAANSGKSAARNFIWRPTLELIAGNQRRERGFGEVWIGAPGASIAVGSTFQESVMIPDILMVRFAASVSPPPDHILVRIRVEYAFTGAFNKRVEDKIFFVGLAVPSDDPARPHLWRVNITPEFHLRDWGQPGPFQNQ